MQLTTLFATLFVSTTLVASVPTSNSTLTSTLDTRGCPKEFKKCGVCNGTMCKWGLFSYGCDYGKCTAKSGGGDGTLCGLRETVSGVQHTGWYCPGR